MTMNRQLFAKAWMLLLAAFMAVPLSAQVLTVQVDSEGGLWDALEAQGVTNFAGIKQLKVTGAMGSSDFLLIKNQMTALESIDLSGTNITEVPNAAFQYKETLKVARLPKNITRIGSQAFENCIAVESVTFGDQTAVSGKIVFPATLRYVDYNAFYSCQLLTNLNFTACASLEGLSSSAFYNLPNLKEVLFPSQGNIRLEWYCFNVESTWDEETQQWIYKGLEKITLTPAITSLSGYSLPRTLKTLYVESSTPPSCSNDAFNHFFENGNPSIKVYIPKGSKRNYAIADGWSRLYTYMEEMGIQINISGYGTLQRSSVAYANGSVIFTEEGSATTLKAVPESGNSIVSVTLNGNAVSAAADGTFTIPAGTTTGTLTVAFTSNPLTVQNPNGGELKELLSAMGSNASTLRTLKVVGKMNTRDWNFVSSSLQQIEMLDISETDTKSVPEQALRNKETLTTVHLPSTVTNIGNEAFAYCPQLTVVDGCENVKEIGSSAFYDCKKLTTFPFGQKIDRIESSAFGNCSSLPLTLVMPASLTYLGWNNVFTGSSIRTFDLSQCALNCSFGYDAFGECTSLALPEKGNYQLSCQALRNAKLTELRLPSAITSLECDNVLPTMLQRLYVSTSTPINVSSNDALKNIDFDNCTLYVPVGSKADYEAANGWANFTNIKEYGLQVVVAEQGKVRSGSQTMMGTTSFFPTGESATFDIVPNDGWHAESVTVNGTAVAITNNRFTLNGSQLDGKLVVTFAINQFNLQLQITGNGKAKLGSLEYTASQTLAVDSLSKLNFTLEPAAGLMVSSITFNGKESVVQNGGTNYVTPAITANSTLAITFGASGATGDVATYTVTTSDYGTVEYLNTSLLPQTTIMVKKDADAIFTLKPDDYCVIEKVLLDGTDVTSQVDANGLLVVKNVSADATLDVTFGFNPELVVALTDGLSLNSALTDAQKQMVTKLTVTGQLSQEDYYTMRDKMPLLEEIDLSDVDTSNMDWVPGRAFCLTDSWDNPGGKSSLVSVRLPKGTKWIYSFAFAGCTNLKEVNFTELNNLEWMDSRAFGWTALSAVDLSQTKLTSISDQFYKVQGMENVRLPKTLTYLGDVFRESSLMEIDLSNCTELKTLESTFYGSKKLEKVILPEGITTINGAFYGCESLTSINFPKSLRSIGNSAFYQTKIQTADLAKCTELVSLSGWGVFSSYRELKEVTLPASLQTIGETTFSNTSITTIDLSKTQVKDIPSSAFSDCRQLENIKLPAELKTIGNYAFNGCEKLAGVLELPATITSIGEGAFLSTQIPVIRCNATTPPAITANSFSDKWEAAFVPEGCAERYKSTEIWEDKVILDGEVHAEVTVTFEGNLANDIVEQAKMAPARITHLKVHGPLGAKDFAIMRSNMTLLYDLDMEDAECSIIPEQAFLDKKVLMNVKLPRELLVIQESAFQGCSSLKGTLTLPAGVTTIGWAAFQGCSSLEKVELSSALEVIRGWAFEGCSSLQQEITFPERFTSIGEYAFANCRNLEGTVKFNKEFYMFMGNDGYWSSTGRAFENCSKIETVDMSDCEYLYQLPWGVFAGCTSLQTVMLPPYTERIENEGFRDCASLSNISFPKSLMYIDDYAFYNSASLQRVDLSDCKDFATIGNYAFANCASLESVSLPKSLNWIQSYAFSECRKLGEFNVEALQPADLGEYVFRHVHTERCVLSIPTGTYSDYLSAPQWGEFVSMRKAIDVSLDEGAALTYSSGGEGVAAARGMRRAPSAVGQQAGVNVKDGSSLYVAENENVTFYIDPEENVSIKQVLFNGEDVTAQLQDNAFVTPGMTENTSFQVLLNVDGPISVKELRMLNQTANIREAESTRIEATVYPTNATNKTVRWSSSDETVATVAEDGTVTGVSAGRAIITAKTEDGNYEQQCEVVVMSNDYYITLEKNMDTFVEYTCWLPVMLHNADAAQGIQFDVYLPEGLGMDYEWSGDFGVALSERAQGHSVSAARRADGSVRVVVYSLNGQPFNDHDGQLLRLPISTRENTGEFKVEIKNIHISGPNSYNFSAPDYSTTLSVKDYPLGDSNGDGEVSVFDATNTVDNILERWTERFIKKAADVNGDGIITVSDVTATIDVILERPSAARSAQRAAAASDDKVFIDDFQMGNGQQKNVSLRLTNTGLYTAFQCDIVLPEGLTVAENDQHAPMVNISSANAQNHIVQANYIGNGALRLLVMSMSNQPFAGNDNDVVSLTIEAGGETGQKVISIENVRLVNVENRTESTATSTQATVDIVDAATGISQAAQGDDLKVSVNGHEIIVQANGDASLRLVSADGKQRVLKVSAGTNSFLIPQSGVYVLQGRKIVIK